MPKRRTKRQAKSKPKLVHRQTKALALRPEPTLPPPMAPDQILAARQLFWHNVMREILTSLSMLCTLRPERAAATDGSDELAAEAEADRAARGEPTYDPSLFDGRLAVMTNAGERIAIANVFPLFACGINNPADRGLSVALECTVFQISTPDGHVFTLPLHDIRAFHALTPELMQKLERVSRRKRPLGGGKHIDDDQPPFGFAAFTSLIQGPPRAIEPAPDHPTE